MYLYLEQCIWFYPRFRAVWGMGLFSWSGLSVKSYWLVTVAQHGFTRWTLHMMWAERQDIHWATVSVMGSGGRSRAERLWAVLWHSVGVFQRLWQFL